jgi:hypothetical protein
MKAMKCLIVSLFLTGMSIAIHAQSTLPPQEEWSKNGITFREGLMRLDNFPSGAQTFRINSYQYVYRESGKYRDMWVYGVDHLTIFSIAFYKNDQGQWMIKVRERERSVPQMRRK